MSAGVQLPVDRCVSTPTGIDKVDRHLEFSILPAVSVYWR